MNGCIFIFVIFVSDGENLRHDKRAEGEGTPALKEQSYSIMGFAALRNQSQDGIERCQDDTVPR